jgi:heme A synthase
MEVHVFGDGDSFTHYSNASTEKRYREETEEERATYRRWIRGIVVFYCVLALVTGLLVAVNYSGAGFTQLTHLSGRPAATSPRAD